MRELTSGQRQHLRRLAHDIRPVVQIGKQGVTDKAVATVDQALDAHELIKIKFLDYQDQRHALSADLATSLGAALVGVVGNVAIVYRRQRDPERRKIELS